MLDWTATREVASCPRNGTRPKRSSTSADGRDRHRQRPGRARLLPEARDHRAKMRDQLLNGELFYTLKEAQIIIERWRIHYNTVRPHSSLGGQPPAPETIQLAS